MYTIFFGGGALHSKPPDKNMSSQGMQLIEVYYYPNSIPCLAWTISVLQLSITLMSI